MPDPPRCGPCQKDFVLTTDKTQWRCPGCGAAIERKT